MVATSENETSLYPPIETLSDELLEEILSRLPLDVSISASAVCKRWKSLLLSPNSFCRYLAVRHYGNRPWFFLTGVNHFLAVKNQAFGYDPESGRWHRFPAFQLPPYDQGSLTGTHGLLFALAGTGICKLGFTSFLFNNQSWRETPPLQFSRRSPIAAIMRNTNGGHGLETSQNASNSNSSYIDPSPSFHLIVAGGKTHYDQLVVEIYDSETNAWELCAPLPHQFRLSSTSQWMQSTVFDGKFIAYETHTGFMSYLDLNLRQWSNAALLRTQDNVVYSFLIGCGTSLILTGLCRTRSGPQFKLWLVDFVSLGCTELGKMPDYLFSLFYDEDEEKDPCISCVGGGDFIYMYSDTWLKDYAACLCDISCGKLSWRKMPSLPAPVNRFDKVVCFSSSITPDALL